MSLSALILFLKANPAILSGVLSVLLAISEALGALPKVKANGIVSFVLIQVEEYLKRKGGK